MRNTIRICSYRKHVIYYDVFTQAYLVAIKRDGTDTCFATIDDAYNAIDTIEDGEEGIKMTYHVEYKLSQFGEVKSIDVVAKSKKEAYRKAVFEMIPEIAYSAWVASVTYQNGNHREFNTFEGNPY